MVRPNILFVFSDQHRWSDLGCYGHQEIQSPHFDAFAEEGVCFENCLSNCPLCVPARGTLLTGQLPLKHGAIGNDLPIRPETTSVADVLNMAGYHTGYVGKWHLAGVPRHQAIPPGRGRLGFKEWKVANCSHDYMNSYFDDEDCRRHPIEGYEPTAQTNLAIDFIKRNRNQEEPWALWLSWGPPHDPYRAIPQHWLDQYPADKLSLAPNVRLPVTKNPHNTWDEAQLRQAMQGYYAHISALDAEFGRILHCLTQTDQENQTLVVYTSDHGDMLGSHGCRDKQLPYEESIHIPLLMRWPELGLSGRRRQLIGLADLAPTLLGAVGLSFPDATDGQDLSSLLTDCEAPGPDQIYLMDYTACHQSFDRGTPAWRAIRTQDHLFAKTSDGRPWLFFDLNRDPLQRNNLIGRPELMQDAQALGRALDALVEKHDAYYDPEALIPWCGLLEAWNESQREFNLPQIATSTT